MTSEEIKEQVLMPDLVRQYGIKIGRNGMCKCPFHNDKKPSAKVYKTSLHCFACGWDGDVFSFVMGMENCSFKDAFKQLGGEYEHSANGLKKIQFEARNEARKAREERAKREEISFLNEITNSIKICEKICQVYPPLSDEWSQAFNWHQLLDEAYKLKYKEEEEINEINVHRICEQVRCSIIL